MGIRGEWIHKEKEQLYNWKEIINNQAFKNWRLLRKYNKSLPFTNHLNQKEKYTQKIISFIQKFLIFLEGSSRKKISLVFNIS